MLEKSSNEKSLDALPTTTHCSERRHSYSQVAMVVAFYWTTSISMVFANKYLVGDRFQGVNDISIFVGWAQCVSTVLVVICIVYIRRILLGHDITLPGLERKILLNNNFLVFVFVFIGMLIFSNLCLKYVGIAFFQVARSCTLIFVVILSVILLKEVASCGVVVSCLLVVAGFCLGVDQEKVSGSLSVTGVLYGVTSSLFIALNGIMSKRFLPLVRYSSLSSVYYMNFGGMIGFLPLLLASGQINVVLQHHLHNPIFMVLLFVSGLLSFLIGFASTLQIDVTSPTTHHISNNSKSVLQTIMAVAIFAESKTMLWWCSNFLVIAGALAYVRVKLLEDSKRITAAAMLKQTQSLSPSASSASLLGMNGGALDAGAADGKKDSVIIPIYHSDKSISNQHDLDAKQDS